MIVKKPLISIIDYGVGNHKSVYNSLSKLGFRSRITNDIELINSSDVLVLPGVGAFPEAMKKIKENGLINCLKDSYKRNKPLLGICLGMQLFTESSNEDIYTKGLGFIPGKCNMIKDKKGHIGWNSINLKEENKFLNKSNNKDFYFNHLYEYIGDEKFILANSFIKDSDKKIASIIKKENVIGLQFHPEKSQNCGLEILDNIIKYFLY